MAASAARKRLWRSRRRPRADAVPEERPGRVLAFDSGIGGLGVVRALRAALPAGTVIDYLADNALFPYGEQPDDRLVARIVALIGAAIADRRPDVVLIACNTASTLALASLRMRYDLPFVGCVPPVRWAARVSTSRVIGILATAATARRPYLRALRDEFAPDCTLLTHGARGLADLAERSFLGTAVPDELVARELDSLFSQPEGARIDAVGLGCTHYTFLADAFARLSPPGVHWLDPADAVAHRVATVLAPRSSVAGDLTAGDTLPFLPEEMLLTGPPPDAEALDRAVRRIGYHGFRVLTPAETGEAPQLARLTV
ncbi:aspartate/glutamate racemase family protein [Acidomonas methanolica]|nr:aspartate/glutamate racemase family protein [Acidomonas methanolica]